MSLGMIALLAGAARGKFAIAGFLLGLIFLTKAEVFLAAGITGIVGLCSPSG